MSFKTWCLNLLFPIKCLACGQEGQILCSTCFQKLKFNTRAKKYNLNIPNLNQVFVAGDYNDPLLAKLIKKFKYSFIISLGPILAHFLINFWKNLKLKDSSLILIPIPLSKKRYRWRGFNQAKILAQEFGKKFNYPLNLELKRKNNQQAQAKLRRKERFKNIKGTFIWTGANLSGKTILLIDDVLTTGATLSEAAQVLRQAGAQKIYGLVIARGR